jgi:hypothetical protein
VHGSNTIIEYCVLNAFYFFEEIKKEESNTEYVFCKNSRMAFFNPLPANVENMVSSE